MNPNFNTFDEIQHKPLRIYNRVVQLYNLREDFGPEVAEQYVNIFTPAQRKAMYLVAGAVKKVGKDAVYKMVTKDLQVVDNV